MLRIVHIDTGRELRGGQRQLLLLARGLGQRGHEQLIVCPEGSALEARALQDGFAVFSLRRRGLQSLSSLLRLRRELRRGGFQILHAHDGRGQTVSALASLGLPVRRVATRRVTFMPQGLRLFLRLHRLQYGSTCNGIIAVSRFVRDLLVRSGIAASRIEVIPDGVEIPPGLPDAAFKAKVRREWGLDSGAFVMGHAGAFTCEKGQDILIRAFLHAGPRLAGGQLLLAGEGPLRGAPKMQELIRQTRDRARVLDFMEDLTPFFAALDLYVMPSRAEGLGSSALLAMAYGLPVVASRVGGLPEVVEEDRTGWLVPANSSSALAEALVTAASDRERLARFGACARERVRAFSDDTMVSRTEALYLRLTAGLVIER